MTDAAKRAAEFAKRYLAQRDQLKAELESARTKDDARRISELTRDLKICEKYIADNRLDRFKPPK
ncbi:MULTISPECIES: hypothetical protein [Ensifer]|uniref:Uncharacterized protein n=1 Tax=Ensifer canadensis TaxID=555315 RepID=A0AAW4FHL5_9HYPH|nr:MULTISPECIES: hypothetical protein [Ensifer]KQW62691.1 hypothetical protein ASD02_00735 [Ensifer sp. Root1252]KRC83511.1 hypothetical protein ASE32_00730 [Ensifer sp. Root231]KRC86583.1 hypothetical protein ASE47_16920 [Ensifer sp. Root258]MBM3091620.1 hypothetical protein [Ensifer canadensis]UBI74394.1 hypothetical protein J3R84_12930 [Ensifer canadensis]